MSSVKAKASEPADVLVPAETANAPCRPERLASKSLNRPLNLKHRKLRLGLPPTIVSRRSSGQIKKTPDLGREESKPRSNLYLLPKETLSTRTSNVVRAAFGDGV